MRTSALLWSIRSSDSPCGHYNSGMKTLVLLFDIDGTLITTGGAGQHAIGETIASDPADSSWVGEISFAGRTDRSIFRDFFRYYGMEESEENFQTYTRKYVESLEKHLTQREGRVLPGVIQALQWFSDQPNVRLGLLTGNLPAAAQLKLTHYQLDHYFFSDGKAVGGFGDQQLDRDDVARDALAHVRKTLVPDILAKDIWIIGDTPNDVRCARAIGANVLAVATGRYHRAELHDCQPDLTVANLEEASPWWHRLQSEHGILPPAASETPR